MAKSNWTSVIFNKIFNLQHTHKTQQKFPTTVTMNIATNMNIEDVICLGKLFGKTQSAVSHFRKWAHPNLYIFAMNRWTHTAPSRYSTIGRKTHCDELLLTVLSAESEIAHKNKKKRILDLNTNTYELNEINNDFKMKNEREKKDWKMKQAYIRSIQHFPITYN